MATAIDPTSHADEPAMGSDRNFGFVFAGVFAVIALWPLVGGHAPRWWGLAVGAVFALVALAKPAWLHPLNYLWFRFGTLLARVVAPVVMAAVFFLCVTPMGLIMRLMGKDLLSVRRAGEAKSYWIAREPPGPEPGTMKNQF
jgi:hypothetical protein